MMRIAATLVVKMKVTPVLNPVTAVQIVIPIQLMFLMVAEVDASSVHIGPPKSKQKPSKSVDVTMQ